MEQDLNATKADRKHKNKISYAEFSVAIKGVLLGMLAGSKYKKVKEMNPVLEEAYATREMNAREAALRCVLLDVRPPPSGDGGRLVARVCACLIGL